LVTTRLVKHYGGVVGHGLERPVGAITGRDSHALGSAQLTKPCIAASSHQKRGSLVAAFLQKYYGAASGQHQPLSEPLHTIVQKARFGLVTVTLGGQRYALVDIGMRMLQPHELAAAQGFAPDYRLVGTKTQRIQKIGNSVCPPVARAVVEAQFGGPGCPALRQAAK